jgi:calcineurin-like phosphoesterase family protein
MRMKKVYVIGDTHFWHKRIQEFEPIRLQLGPDVETMTWEIAKRWNSVVQPEDIVYHLGDLAFQLGTKAAELKHLCLSLNGQKRLILGNHDRKDVNGVPTREPRINYEELGFEFVSKEPLNFDGYTLSHEPILDTKVFNIHGHIHSSVKEHRSEEAPPLNSPLHFNASIENLPDFKPILLWDILDRVHYY